LKKNPITKRSNRFKLKLNPKEDMAILKLKSTRRIDLRNRSNQSETKSSSTRKWMKKIKHLKQQSAKAKSNMKMKRSKRTEFKREQPGRRKKAQRSLLLKQSSLRWETFQE
jgi:hypothetical protein